MAELSPDGLVVDGVSVTIDGDLILAPVSFVVEPGASAAIVGPSGSGKTTLLDCLVALRTPSTGRIWLGDKSISDLQEPAASDFRRTAVGMISQDADLLEELDVVDNVALVTRFNGVQPAVARAAARSQLTSVGLAGREGERVGHLSRGEAHRAAIARATCSAVRMLVADEPTAALDRANATMITELLLARGRELAIPLVVSTHDLAVAAACDAVVDIGG